MQRTHVTELSKAVCNLEYQNRSELQRRIVKNRFFCPLKTVAAPDTPVALCMRHRQRITTLRGFVEPRQTIKGCAAKLNDYETTRKQNTQSNNVWVLSRDFIRCPKNHYVAVFMRPLIVLSSASLSLFLPF